MADPQKVEYRTTNLPEYLDKPYQEYMGIYGGQVSEDLAKGMPEYGKERIAGLSEMQDTARKAAAAMKPSEQLGAATNIAGAAARNALDTDYQAGQFANQFQAPDAYQAGKFTPQNVQAQGLTQYQMGPASQVSTQSFAQPGSAQAYMSPYMQNVVDIQQREAQRQADIASTQRGARQAQAGAFGGSRAAIENAEAARNLAQQKGDIQATGLQSAYQQAQQQFNAEQQARLQAQMANQQAGLTVGQQNLAAQLGVQQLGAGQNLQAQLANQQTGMTAQQLAEQSRQFGAGQGLTAAQLGAQYGLAGQQLGEQSRQYGAGLGLQGQQAAMQGAGVLGTLGNLQYQQGMGINQLQAGYGGMQQDIEQQRMNTAYQDFLNKQMYPYQLLNQYGNVLNRQPANMNVMQTTYGQAPNLAGQFLGTVGALGTSQYKPPFAEGGMVQSYADGGVTDSRDVTDESYIAKLIDKMSIQQLQAILGNPSVPRAQKQMASDRLEDLMRLQASAQRGLFGAAENTPSIQQMYPAQEVRGANGGIVAFADGGSSGSVIGKEIMEGLGKFFSRFNPTEAGYSEEVVQSPEAAVERAVALQQKAKQAAQPPASSPPAPKQDELRYDPRTATRRADYQTSAADLTSSDLKGLSSALKGLPSSYKDEVLAAAKEFSKGDEEVNKRLDELLGRDKKRSEDFKNEASRMYWNQFFSGIAKASSEPGPSGFGGFMTAVAKSAGAMPEYEATLRKQQDQYDMLAEKNEADNLKYKQALKDRNFDKALGLEKAIKDNQYQMEHLRQQAAATAAHTKLGLAQLEETKSYHKMLGDVYGKRAEAMQGANKARLAAAEAKVMPMFRDDPNTRKLAKQLEEQYGKNWQQQHGPQTQYWNAYQAFKARTMPSLVDESTSTIPSADTLLGPSSYGIEP